MEAARSHQSSSSSARALRCDGNSPTPRDVLPLELCQFGFEQMAITVDVVSVARPISCGLAFRPAALWARGRAQRAPQEPHQWSPSGANPAVLSAPGSRPRLQHLRPTMQGSPAFHRSYRWICYDVAGVIVNRTRVQDRIQVNNVVSMINHGRSSFSFPI